MAIRLFRVVVVSLAVLLLGSCNVLQYIFGSVFPSTMTLAKAQVDLSKLIPASNNGSTYLRLVETGGYGYVVVVSSPQQSTPSMFFYDLDLNPIKSFTGANAPASSGIMVDVNGQIMAGGTLRNPDLSIVPAGTTQPLNAVGSGVDGFVAGSINVANISNSSSSEILTWTTYTSGWANVSSLSGTLSTGASNLRINALFDDGNPAGNVIMVISQESSNGNNGNTVTGYFLKIPKSAFISAGAFPGPPPFDAPPPHRDNLDGNSFGYANGSIFAYDTKTSSYVRINPADASIQSSFSSASNNNQQPVFAYRLSGGSFYSFDTNTRILTKYTAWW